ncbi:hypothetical protein HK096_002045, partial [Nowakowskiella sp. JEL0078]
MSESEIKSSDSSINSDDARLKRGKGDNYVIQMWGNRAILSCCEEDSLSPPLTSSWLSFNGTKPSRANDTNGNAVVVGVDGGSLILLIGFVEQP